MPIEIQYTEDDMGIVFYAVGAVTGEEIIEKQGEIYRGEHFSNLRYWIVDRSRCTEYKITPDEIRKMAAMDNEAAKANPNLLMALISESDLQYGISRMFEAHLDENGFKTVVCRSRPEAEEWIRNEMDKPL